MLKLLRFIVVIVFFLRNPLCQVKPPGICFKGLVYFKTSGLPGPGQFVYLFFGNMRFLDFLRFSGKKWRPPPLANNPKRETPK